MSEIETVLETERLLSRKFIPEDAEFMLQLLNTEGWLKYIGDRKVRTIKEAEAYLLNGPLKSSDHTFPWLRLIALKSNNTPIGLVSLIKREDLEFIDIGFAFLPAFMGLGYAYEIVSETIKFAFEKLHLEKIIAITLPENKSSIRLLEKLGMRVEGDYLNKETKEILLRYCLNVSSLEKISSI